MVMSANFGNLIASQIKFYSSPNHKFVQQSSEIWDLCTRRNCLSVSSHTTHRYIEERKCINTNNLSQACPQTLYGLCAVPTSLVGNLWNNVHHFQVSAPGLVLSFKALSLIGQHAVFNHLTTGVSFMTLWFWVFLTSDEDLNKLYTIILSNNTQKEL